MLIFLDTEFTDFIDCELISIAMVTVDGAQRFYLEVEDFRREACNAFVQAAVWVHLGKLQDAGTPKAEVEPRIQSWLAQFDEVILACDSQFDLDLLADVLDGNWPGNVTGHLDLRAAMRSAAFQVAAAKAHTSDHPWHHALYDAEAHRQGWLAVEQTVNQREIPLLK